MCGKAIKCTIDSLLLFLLTVQTLLLLTLVYRGYWEIPTWIIEKGFHRNAPELLDLKVDSIRFYPRKGIEVMGVQVLSSECVCPLLSVERLLVLPSDPLIGRSKSAMGLLQNATLYFPDPYLPQSQNLQLVHGLSIRFAIDREKLTLQSFKGYISELTVASLNPVVLDLKALGKNGNKDKKQHFSSKEVFRKLREIRFLHEYFEEAEEALLTFSFEDEADAGRQIANINLYASSSLMMDQVLTQDLYLSGKLIMDGELYMEDAVFGEIKAMRFSDKMLLESVSLELMYEKDEVYSIIPNRIRAHSADLHIMDRPFEYFTAVVCPENFVQGNMSSGFGFGKQYLSTDCSYDLDLKTLDLKIKGDFDPLLLAQDWVGAFDGMEKLKFGGIPHVSAGLRVEDWDRIQDLHFRVTGSDIVLNEVQFQYARTQGRWDQLKRALFLDHFILTRPDNSIRGRLFRSLKTTEYRYLIEGRGIPPDLNPMFKPWWASTWSQFDFQGNPITVDLDIWGTENDQAKRYVYGAMSFEDISFKGLQIDAGEVRLNAISKYIDLFDLRVQNGVHEASGRVQNIYEATGNRQVSEHLNLFSNIPLHVIAPAVGSYLDPFVENTRPDTVADVWIDGVMIKPEFPEFRHLDDLVIKIHVDRPTEFFGFELDRADARVHKTGDHFVIDPVSFEFARGKGSAIFVASGPDDEKMLDFDVSIEDMDFREAIEKISAFNKEEPDNSTTSETGDVVAVSDGDSSADASIAGKTSSPLKRPKDESYLDLVIKGSCPLDSLDGLQAEGHFELDDPLIHRVHIFGGFSKLMDNAELNLGSFSLKRASSPFVVDGRILRLEDLELTGPSSRVRSKGTVNMEDGSLDFRLKAYPLGEVKFPVIAGLALVLRPFAHLFEVQLSGTLIDPDWKVVIDPSGL